MPRSYNGQCTWLRTKRQGFDSSARYHMNEINRTRFDLEQEILQAWGIITDLNQFLKRTPEGTTEEVKTYLSALCTVYEYKFEQVFGTFERMLRNGDIK